MSQHELRVVFPREQRRVWSWPPEPAVPSNTDNYGWGIWLNHGYRPKALLISVWRRAAAPQSSLAELLRAGHGGLCTADMFVQCGAQHDFLASARDNAVELVLRDSAEISWLFGMRPEWVQVFRDLPGQPGRERDSVRVAYLDPQIPMPDSAFMAALDSARPVYVASISRFSRSIRSARLDDRLWVAVGDSVQVEVRERHCTSDLCGRSPLADTAFDWTIADTTIAWLHPHPPYGMYLYGRRTGRTLVRVTGIRSPTDTISWRPALPDSLESEVLVIDLPARIVIEPLAEVVHVGTSMVVQVQAFGIDGERMPDAPITVRAQHGSQSWVSRPGRPVLFSRPGQWTVTASVGSVSTAITVTVIESDPGAETLP